MQLNGEWTTLIIYCLTALAGLLIGWSWRPRFVWSLRAGHFNSLLLKTAKTRISSFCYKASSLSVPTDEKCSSPNADQGKQAGVTEADLETLISYIEGTDGGPPWQLMMERSTTSLAYQAWQRDPEFGPTQYRTRTIIENASPDLMRDFFWDDEFRTKWDDLLIYFGTLQECPHTGTMTIHWIRKFPFFCSDREYVIGRRIWESGSTYYCVTKGTPCPTAAWRRKPKRVDFYFSSWRVKAVEARNGGELTASEILLFHHEETGVPKELVKIGIRRVMWSLVKKMDVAVRSYQVERTSGAPLSRYALRARICTRLPSRFSSPSLGPGNAGERICEPAETHRQSKKGQYALKWLVAAGVMIVCALNCGVICKGIAFGIERGFRRDGKRADKQQAL